MTCLSHRLLLVLALLLPAAAGAAVPEGLYRAEVTVADQSAAERRRATGEGLRQVLVKASGQRAVLALPAVQAELERATSLLASFRYESVPARNGTPGGLRLHLGFDPAGIDALLQRAGAPLWAAARPVVLLWAGAEQSLRAAYAAGTPQGDALLEAAALRALPARLAEGELAPSTLAAAEQEAVLARRGARVALVAGTVAAGARWQAQGYLYVDGQRQALEAAGSDEAAALRELVAVATDRLAARYAVVVQGDQLQALTLVVGGIGSLADHAALQAWLSGLPLVSDLVIERVDAGGAVFLLTLAGDVRQLVDLIRLDGRLALSAAETPGRLEARLNPPR